MNAMMRAILAHVAEHDGCRTTEVLAALYGDDPPDEIVDEFKAAMCRLILSRYVRLEYEDAVWSDVVRLHVGEPLVEGIS